MGDQDYGEQLPHRVRGAAQARPVPLASSALSDELRQRMLAAVSAERARATDQDQPGQDQRGHDQPDQGQPDQERSEPPWSVIASAPADNGAAAPVASRAARPEPTGQPGPAVEPERKVRPARLGTPERAAGPGPPAVASAMDNSAASRLARPRASPRAASARRRLVATSAIAVALIILAAGCLGVAAAKYLASSHAQAETVSPAVQRAEAAARRRTAAWVTQQVSHAAVVSCDPLMCAALTADGFPSRNVRVLGPTSLPTSPLTSAVVVVTQAVRDLFGSSLSSDYAPAVLATFGSADASTTVRVIAPDGAATYYRQLAADLAARKLVGADLVKIRAITLSAEAKQQLVAGQVDSRLMLAIAALASSKAIDILGFGNVGPGADATIPLRFADLAESDQAAHAVSSAYVRTLRANLAAVSPRFRPTTIVTVALPAGQTVLRIEFTAPSPLNLFAPPPSQ